MTQKTGASTKKGDVGDKVDKQGGKGTKQSASENSALLNAHMSGIIV